VSLGLALLCPTSAGFAQDDEAAKANDLFMAGKRLDALPLYEDLAKKFPNEQLYVKRLADCYGAQAGQDSDPAVVKAVLTRMRDAARRAAELGDVPEYIKQMANIDPAAPLYGGINSPGKSLLIEAENAYGAGDYPKALAKYTAAYEADPTLYQAALYAGDTAFVLHDLKIAAPWFARAIAIDPNRETAYRYWGDAILKYDNDPMAAREKFIDAIVAEPYNRLAWQGIRQWAQLEKAVLMSPRIERPQPPTSDPKKPGNITITMPALNGKDPKDNPSGAIWLSYSMKRALWRSEDFNKNFPSEKEYRHTLQEEHDSLTTALTVAKELKVDHDKLDESLRNLVELNDAGMLDCWILINGADNGIAQDYDAYRKQHRQLLHDYLSRFVVHGGVNPAQ
jgi:tetratricopeptide (TPR) repeat protein